MYCHLPASPPPSASQTQSRHPSPVSLRAVDGVAGAGESDKIQSLVPTWDPPYLRPSLLNSELFQMFTVYLNKITTCAVKE